MLEYSERLIEIRKAVREKSKEINELEIEKNEIWKKIEREINDKTAYYKKIEGFSGFRGAKFEDRDIESYIIIKFDSNSKPTASALSNIEKDTGLRFMGNIHPDSYGFGL